VGAASVGIQDIEAVKYVHLDGQINGKDHIKQPVDLNKAFGEMYMHHLQATTPDPDRQRSVEPGYDNKTEIKPWIKQLYHQRPQSRGGEKKYEGYDATAVLETSKGLREYQLEPRTEVVSSPEDLAEYAIVPSFVEMIHNPAKHSSTEENSKVHRLGLRAAIDYSDSFINGRFGIRPESCMYEADLMAQLVDEGGINDQIEKSTLPLEPISRPKVAFISGADSDFMSDISPHIDRTDFYICEWLDERPQDTGFNRQELELAARHQATANALALDMTQDREQEEHFLWRRENGQAALVNVDPEFAIYHAEYDDSRSEAKRRKGITQLGLILDLDRDQRRWMEERTREIQERAYRSSKEWDQILEPNSKDDVEDLSSDWTVPYLGAM
jgi:hypothetical protein